MNLLIEMIILLILELELRMIWLINRNLAKLRPMTRYVNDHDMYRYVFTCQPFSPTPSS